MRTVLLSIILVVVAACSEAGGVGDDLSRIPVDDLGGVCTNVGCGGDLCGIRIPDQCPRKLCLVDVRGGLSSMETYCTAECSAGACPPGWDCVDMSIASDVRRACVAQPRVCGDGIVQRGEGCDDGNVEADDGCSAACEVERPFHLTLTGLGFIHQSTSSGKRTVSFPDIEGDLPLAGDANGCGSATKTAAAGGFALVVTVCDANGSTMRLTARFPKALGRSEQRCGVPGPIEVAASGRIASGATFSVPATPCDPTDLVSVDVLELHPKGGAKAKVSALLVDRSDGTAAVGFGGTLELTR